jgi:hypothetical protein
MAEMSLGSDLTAKSNELKRWFKDKNAQVEQWKFSVEDTREGLRVELHAVALMKHPPKKK